MLRHAPAPTQQNYPELADAVGQESAASALNQSLSKEVDMARWIDEHLADTTTCFLQRSAAGMTAGL